MLRECLPLVLDTLLLSFHLYTCHLRFPNVAHWKSASKHPNSPLKSLLMFLYFYAHNMPYLVFCALNYKLKDFIISYTVSKFLMGDSNSRSNSDNNNSDNYMDMSIIDCKVFFHEQSLKASDNYCNYICVETVSLLYASKNTFWRKKVVRDFSYY